MRAREKAIGGGVCGYDVLSDTREDANAVTLPDLGRRNDVMTYAGEYHVPEMAVLLTI